MNDRRWAAPHRAPTRWRRPLAIVLVVLALAGCGGNAPPSAPPSPSASAGATAVVPSASGPSPQAGLLLTEVRFAPIVGDAAFVEIANVSAAAIDVVGVRLRIGTQDFPISATSLSVAPASQLVVSFDTPGSTDHPGLPAPSGVALVKGPGSVELIDPDGRRLDRIAWGAGQDDAVTVPSGDIDVATLEAGSAIGRKPGANGPSQPADWVVYPPGLVSPGRANPPPPTPGPSAAPAS